MTTQSQAVTAVPTALAGLTAGTSYFLQHTGGQSNVLVAEAAAAPAASSLDAHVLARPGGELTVKPGAGMSIWVWTPGGSARVAWTETS